MGGDVLQIIMALMPFAVLFVGFVAFKADALKLSLIVLVLEAGICMILYQMDLLKLIGRVADIHE